MKTAKRSKMFYIAVVAFAALAISLVMSSAVILFSPSYTGTATISEVSKTRKHCIVDAVLPDGSEMEIRLGKGRVCNKVEVGETVQLENSRLAN